jgi:predicted dehydrogenase
MDRGPLRVLVVGCGHMGAAHARAYHAMAGFEIAGIVARRPDARDRLAAELGGAPAFSNFEEALAATRPDAVCVSTYPDTHERFCVESLRAGAHVFVEKPLAEDLAAAERVIQTAQETKRALVVGYILRHHPTWTRFVELAATVGKPLVMRISQNHQSTGEHWRKQQQLMRTVSPIVDCAVHYVDVMCQMTGARPTHVQAMGVRLAPELPEGMYNYGQLQLRFEDGSVGWYEAGWGPMMSDEAVFIKDVVGPQGSVTLRDGTFVRHHRELDVNRAFLHQDESMKTPADLSLVDLCRREQEFFARAIREDIDLSAHHDATQLGLRIVLAADRSIREGTVVTL